MVRRISLLQTAASCCLILCVIWDDSFRANATQPCSTPKKYALLVGCSDYQSPFVSDLWGPVNDVPLWSDVLVDHFGFNRADVRCLVGWPVDPKDRPTRDNIVRAIDDLIDRSGAGDQIVLFLSGHGLQLPDLRRENELGVSGSRGVVGAFLPADVSLRTGKAVENVITYAEIAQWLARARLRGVNVLGVFDCCHSSGLIHRYADVIIRSGSGRHEPLGLVSRAGVQRLGKGKHGDKGSLVAIYASEWDEETVELPRPAGADHVRENYHSLLSYNLICILTRLKEPISYGELIKRVADRYHAERGDRPPTMSAEGDLESDVLGEGRERGHSTFCSPSEVVHVDEGSLRGPSGPPSLDSTSRSRMAYPGRRSASDVPDPMPTGAR